MGKQMTAPSPETSTAVPRWPRPPRLNPTWLVARAFVAAVAASAVAGDVWWTIEAWPLADLHAQVLPGFVVLWGLFHGCLVGLPALHVAIFGSHWLWVMFHNHLWYAPKYKPGDDR